MFSFGIVLCEVGPGAGGGRHQAWWLGSTPRHSQAAGWKSAGAAHSSYTPGGVWWPGTCSQPPGHPPHPPAPAKPSTTLGNCWALAPDRSLGG